MGNFMTVLKVLFSGGLIWWVFASINFASAWAELRGLPLLAVIGAFGAVSGQLMVAASRLQLLIRLAGQSTRFIETLDAILIGGFFSQTMISFVGGDAMRIWRLKMGGIPVGVAARSVLYDRIFGFLGLMALIVAGLPTLFGVIPDTRVQYSILLLILVAILGCLALIAIQRIRRFLPAIRSVEFLVELSRTGSEILSSGRRFWQILALAILVQILNVMIVYSVGLGLGVQMSLLHFLVLVPPVLFLSMMPISFAGWGVREGAMVAALSAVGVPAHQSLAMSIAYGLVNVVASLPGGVLWLVSRRSVEPIANAGERP